MQTVCGDLRSAFDATVQIPEESSRVCEMTLANMERGNEFSVCVDSDVYPCITDLRGIALANAAIFLLNIRPNFVDLNVLHVKVSQLGIHERLAALR
jgi:hypothetical protein